MSDQTPTNLDLSPEVINLEIQQGTDVSIEVQLTNGTGAPVNITNDTIKITAKDEFGGVIKIATKTISPGNHSDPANGKTIFTWSKADTTTTTPKDEVDWKWEVRRVLSGSAAEVVYIHGDLKLMPSVGL
jgi:hypothetical protein